MEHSGLTFLHCRCRVVTKDTGKRGHHWIALVFCPIVHNDLSGEHHNDNRHYTGEEKPYDEYLDESEELVGYIYTGHCEECCVVVVVLWRCGAGNVVVVFEIRNTGV